ncbi:DUF5684 domain-containing protein [Mucilaginibacter lappiensis]|uniref:Signal peptidase I n=1 Tax=Mucilaginibacter lappiensis TaxID=354630 RepID=A0A1N7GHZ5_9SPHI|nr:DUF5684 domain-containing protein [Mucilaginibacter lappiensis]MBB6113073.1 hypothetical protein [Mucilaginibacter lappiensis]MBB6129671.1 hypothetical protein [Mucilaginibacter lappiensis]SIS12207.1 hypothetical protein SAMN05421821_12925 [Mucilaginibacter lappiensis]
MQDYDPSSAPSAGAMAALFGAFLIPALIISVILIVSMWKIYTKAGKPGWAAIIPIYNIIVLLEIVGKPTWWVILFLVPCANIVVAVWVTNLLSKSFGQSEGFTIGLLLLSFVFYPILGFGNYQYLGPAGAGFIGGGKPFDPSTNYQDPFNNTPPPPQV